jgi:hypothetical protein
MCKTIIYLHTFFFGKEKSDTGVSCVHATLVEYIIYCVIASLYPHSFMPSCCRCDDYGEGGGDSATTAVVAIKEVATVTTL